MIFINEEIVAKYLDRNLITSNKHALKLGMVLIKYYKHLGLSNSEIKEKLIDKIKIKNDNNGTISNYIYNTLVMNMNVCGEFRNKPIPIYKKDLELIDTLDNIKIQKFFFVFIVMCRAFNNMVRLQKKEVMRLSRLPESTKYFDKYFDELCNLGFVDAGITKYKIKNESKTMMYYCLTDGVLPDETDEVEFYIEHTNDPVLYFLKYKELEDVRFCEICGAPFIKSKKQTRGRLLCQYCKEEQHHRHH